MSTTHTLATASFIALIALTAPAQAQTASAASAPAAGAKVSSDCAKPMARHDHAAERGMPAAKSAAMPCAPAAAASATSKKPAHDHAKFHKNS